MPTSKLSLFCDKVIEAGWLAVLITTPLFFNNYCSQSFDPNKMALLRTIAAVMALFWIIGWFEQRAPSAPRLKSILGFPLVVPVLVFCGISIVCTLTSVTPVISFLGTYLRAQGTSSTLAYILVFFMLSHKLREQKQVQRLMFSIIIGSFPVALYAIIQHVNLDPLQWSFEMVSRPSANMGNPIFTGGYLIMVFFPTAGQIIASLRGTETTKKSNVYKWASIICFGLIGLAQLTAIVLTQSRGPLLGWLAGTFLFFFVLALLAHKRKLVFIMLILAIGSLLSLAILKLSHSPLQHNLRTESPFERLGTLTESKIGTGRVRVLMWQGVTHLVMPHEPLESADGGKDILNIVRPFIGYGPETMYITFNRFFEPELGQIEARTLLPDRSHNETFDLLACTGLIGFLAYQFLLIALFVFCFRSIGLISSKRQSLLFICLWGGLGLVAGLGTILLRVPFYFGLGVPLGNIAAIFIYPCFYLLRGWKGCREALICRRDRILLAAIIAAVTAHYIEIQFGIAVASTRVLFWTYMAMIAAIGSGRVGAQAPNPAAAVTSPGTLSAKKNNKLGKKEKQSWRKPPAVFPADETAIPKSNLPSYALLIAILLSTLFFDFIANSTRSSDPVEVFWHSLLFDKTGKISVAIFGMFFLTWLLAIILVALIGVCSGWLKKNVRVRAATMAWIIVGPCLAALFGFMPAYQQARFTQMSTNSIDAVMSVTGRLADFSTWFYGWIFLLIGAIALALMGENGPMPAKLSVSGWKKRVLYAGLCCAAVYLILVANLNRVRADCFGKQADIWDQHGETVSAIAGFKRAFALAPYEEHCAMMLGKTMIEQAAVADSISRPRFDENITPRDIIRFNEREIPLLTRRDLLLAAQAVLTDVRAKSPLNTDHSANLARLYMRWGMMTRDSVEKGRLFDRAGKCFADAKRLSPNNAVLLNESAAAEFVRKNMEGALAILDKSIKLDDKYIDTYYGAAEILRQKGDLAGAAELYKKGLQLAPGNIKAQNMLAFLYFAQGKSAEAMSAYQKLAVMKADSSMLCNTYKNMAVLYQRANDIPAAIIQVQKAIALASAQYKPGYEKYLGQLKAQDKR
ncbi:MAG: O-antigen ligase family protein [Chitinivibrionales bacterium]|nr:O-antigen ligase family protein [Chitinivibrionales bacterium]